MTMPAARPADAALVVFAVAPRALGGVRLHAPAGPQREGWLQRLKALLPDTMPWRRLPAHIGDEALLGGLDLAATLAAGRPIAQAGLLAQAADGVIVAAMAERIGPALASRLAAALDAPEAAPAIVALDEGVDDEAPPASLLDRLALHVQFDPGPDGTDRPATLATIRRARMTWTQVSIDDSLVEALVATAMSLGVISMRAACHALTVTRIAAALDGRDRATEADASLAARLVLAPRATQRPLEPESSSDTVPEPSREPCDPADDSPTPAPPPEPSREPQATEPLQGHADTTAASDHDRRERPRDGQPLEDRLVEAACAAIPPGLLASLTAGKLSSSRRGDAGRVGRLDRSPLRGRPVGAIRGEPRRGARLALIETLRAAAPWQRARRAQARRSGSPDPGLGDEHLGRVFVTREDLRIQRRLQHRATTTIFAIDASGSQAMHRLAEAKGAVELLLADCYARRDRVAVIGFRGEGAQLLLAPTRSLVRARRQLAGLPGGGGTPLAAGIDAAAALASGVRRSGASPLVVLLTDGRANIARGGQPGRTQAQADALAAARAFGAAGTPALWIDTSQQPGEASLVLAATMHARWIPLPHAAADTLYDAVRRARSNPGDGSQGPRRA